MTKWVDIGEVLTPEFKAEIKQGTVLVFNKDGIKTNYKVMRRDKKTGKIWAYPIPLYTIDEFNALMGQQDKNADSNTADKN